jgi:hypothetical protein
LALFIAEEQKLTRGENQAKEEGTGNRTRRLEAAAQAQHQVESGLLLDVVVRQGAAVFELFAGEDQTLLVRRDTCTSQTSEENEALTQNNRGRKSR